MNIVAGVILLMVLSVGIAVIIYAGIYYVRFCTRGYFVCVKRGKSFIYHYGNLPFPFMCEMKFWWFSFIMAQKSIWN